MAVLGLLAGFSVVFFIEVPDNSFWSFYYWSSRHGNRNSEGGAGQGVQTFLSGA